SSALRFQKSAIINQNGSNQQSAIRNQNDVQRYYVRYQSEAFFREYTSRAARYSRATAGCGISLPSRSRLQRSLPGGVTPFASQVFSQRVKGSASLEGDAAVLHPSG